MRDSWLGLGHRQLSRDRNLELITWLLNRHTSECLREREINLILEALQIKWMLKSFTMI